MRKEIVIESRFANGKSVLQSPACDVCVRIGPDQNNRDKRIEIAQAHGVRVVNGRVVVPDLQVEYQNAEGQLTRVNLELATKNYRAGHLQAKAQAGFALYAPAQDSGRLRRVLNDREITAEILSL